MTDAEALKLIPFVRHSYNTKNFTKDSYTAGQWFGTVENALKQKAERRGRWIEEYSKNHFQAKCSACGESTLYGITYDLEGNAYYMNYCPNCGAKMEETE